MPNPIERFKRRMSLCGISFSCSTFLTDVTPFEKDPILSHCKHAALGIRINSTFAELIGSWGYLVEEHPLYSSLLTQGKQGVHRGPYGHAHSFEYAIPSTYDDS